MCQNSKGLEKTIWLLPPMVLSLSWLPVVVSLFGSCCVSSYGGVVAFTDSRNSYYCLWLLVAARLHRKQAALTQNMTAFSLLRPC